MLGHVAQRFLAEQGWEVVTSDLRYRGGPDDPLVEAAIEADCDWYVNGLGRIKQKSTEQHELMHTNVLFPLHLASRLSGSSKLIQPGTDCVFSGKEGFYPKDHPHNAEDVYGFSKSLAEKALSGSPAIVIRTSIIGPELLDAPKGLMGWFLKQEGGVNGFTNHIWNGITTLEWSRLCAEIIRGEIGIPEQVVQPGSKSPVSKCELLKLISETWDHECEVNPFEAPETIDRSLEPDVVRPDIQTQLKDFRDWYRSDPKS